MIKKIIVEYPEQYSGNIIIPQFTFETWYAILLMFSLLGV